MAVKTPCQTMGARYHTHVSEGAVRISVDWSALKGLSSAEASLLIDNIHNALELVLAPYSPKKEKTYD